MEQSKKEAKTKKIDIDAEIAAIENTRTAFQLAIKEGRYQDLAKYSTTDMKNITPGSEDWMEMYKLSAERGRFPYDSIKMNPQETVILNDTMAYDLGNSVVYFTDASGQVMELYDSYLVILKKDKDGVWKVHREVASSNVP